MKGARNGLFFALERLKKQTFFHDAHILMDQLALHVRFPNAAQEPLWARNMRPLRLPDPCPLARGRLQSFGAALPLLRLIGFGARGARPHIHHAVTVGGPYWHIGTSSVPSPATTGADPASAFSFGVISPYNDSLE